MDTPSRLPADGAGNGSSPRASDEDDVSVIVHDLLDGDGGRIGDERLGAHRDTSSGEADNRRRSLSHSGAWTSVTKAVEEPTNEPTLTGNASEI